MGRPSILTPELQGELVKLLEGGATHNLAAATVRISTATFQSWLAKGRAEEQRLNMGYDADEAQEQYLKFAEAVTRAQAKPVLRCLALIQVAAEKDWRAAAWYAEHVTPELALRVNHFVHVEDSDVPSVAEHLDVSEGTGAEIAQLIHLDEKQRQRGEIGRGNGSGGNGKAV